MNFNDSLASINFNKSGSPLSLRHMKKLILKNPVIDLVFLQQNINAENLIILDASMPSVGEKDFRIPEVGIKGARYIPWKKDFTDISSTLPNMLPSADYFTNAAQLLGIKKDSAIVVYDGKGIYSSPRIYWMFKTMGHDNIAVLDGGFPDWKRNKGSISKLNFGPYMKGDFEAKFNQTLVKNQEDVSRVLKNNSCTILDARSSGRFNGTSPEPRAILRSGHIPGSNNLPYSELLEEGKFKSKETLHLIISSLLKKNDNEIIFTCGSGITASILFLAAEHCGMKNLSLYDGSWSEWGLPSKYPIN